MALTETQKSQTRLWLGYESSRDMYPYLETKLDDLTATEETIVGATLTSLTAVDTALGLNVTGSVHGVKRVDEIEMKDGNVDADYCAAGKRLVSRLESVLGVSRRFDVFSAHGINGGGGMIGLG